MIISFNYFPFSFYCFTVSLNVSYLLLFFILPLNLIYFILFSLSCYFIFLVCFLKHWCLFLIHFYHISSSGKQDKQSPRKRGTMGVKQDFVRRSSLGQLLLLFTRAPFSLHIEATLLTQNQSEKKADPIIIIPIYKMRRMKIFVYLFI